MQRVLLGEMVIDREPPIELHVELPYAETHKKSAALKDRLAYLLDTRFRPADPNPEPEPCQSHTLTVAGVADLLRCHCQTVLRMMRRGRLHPVSDEHGELQFDPAEIESVRYISPGSVISRFISRN